ncbi:MAG: hypothetical protein KQ78_00305 [Candidatus Izimaplasma bacterium HR2]|nr:MAG: hypothetical protein KQ78_00305 [Candidatus Izimaplasma bacterium HR2]
MEEREISIKELINVIWRGKVTIVMLASAFLFIGAVTSFVYDKTNSQVSTVLTLQWNGVTRGEYPDGTRFDYNTAIESYVISMALEAEGIEGLTTNDVREAIDMVPIVPSDISSVILTALEEGEQISYYPTDYKIVVDNGALDLSVQEATDFLNELIDQMRFDFEKKYIQQSVILDFTDADFDEYDYIEVYSILNTQITLIDNAMNNRVGIDPGFVSPTLGIGFADILVRTSLVRQIDLSQISSRTNTYLLTKDVDYLITNYTYQIDVKQLDLNKALVNVADAQLMVDNYAGSVNTIIIPGMDTNLEIDTYYNTLINNLVILQKQVSDLSTDIDYYELQIDRLSGDDPNFDISIEKLAEEIAKVEASILNADTALEGIISDSNTLLIEYNVYTTSNIIKPLMAPQYESSISVVMYTGIGLIVGAGIGAVVVLFKHEWE